MKITDIENFGLLTAAPTVDSWITLTWLILLVGQSHTRHLYRKNTLVMSFREAQRREIFGYKASLDPTEKISRPYRRSK